MQSELENPAPDTMWELVSPYLDDALMQLGEQDRQAVLLHFFERKTFNEVGRALGSTEDTARKRTSRALEKLRAYLSKRGVVSSTLRSSRGFAIRKFSSGRARWFAINGICRPQSPMAAAAGGSNLTIVS